MNKLLREKQHTPLVPLFIDYIEKAGVEKNLVDEFKSRI
jgi:hypothetical protein